MNNIEKNTIDKPSNKSSLPAPKGLRLMRINGISIEIGYSWFIIAAFLTFGLSSSLMTLFNFAALPAIGFGLVVMLAFFGSLLLHELAHSLVAKARGLEVDNIRLFILGGVSNIKTEPRTAFEEFIISVVGPATNFVLAAIFGLAQWLVGTTNEVASWTLGYLFYINLGLAVFNLLPAYPLDGGRVLRSIIWGITKNYQRATKISSSTGQAAGWFFIGLGIWLVFAGLILDGFILAMVGWYLKNSARLSYQQTIVTKALSGVKVGQVMHRPPEVVNPDSTVAQVAYDYLRARQYPVVAVVDQGYLVGLVTEADLQKIAPGDWQSKKVADIMTWRARLQVANLEDDLEETVKRMAENKQVWMPVLNEEKYFVGLMSLQDVTNYVRFMERWGNK